ncbi:hypothetical protein BSKO_07481 [Bryopsis sp. KO-2023]|nr:hypothetical protein BSKO_07481 [Bryopsis sp. KO-2023]
MKEDVDSAVLVESEVDGFENVEFKEHQSSAAGMDEAKASSAQVQAGSSEIVPDTSNAPTVDANPNALSPEEQALRDIAATAGKVAERAKIAVKGAEEAAKSLSMKFNNVVETQFNSVVESNDTFSKIAGGISSWWANLDPVEDTAERPAEKVSASRVAEQVQQLYGLSESDTLLEQFPCKLWQPYSCSANKCTPPVQLAYPVMLNVTELNFCFCAMDKDQKYKSVIPHARLKAADKVTTSDGVDTLEVALNDGHKMVFRDFESDTALESALALLEHLAASDR